MAIEDGDVTGRLVVMVDWRSMAVENGDGLRADEGSMEVENGVWIKAVEVGGRYVICVEITCGLLTAVEIGVENICGLSTAVELGGW